MRKHPASIQLSKVEYLDIGGNIKLAYRQEFSTLSACQKILLLVLPRTTSGMLQRQLHHLVDMIK